MSMQYCNDPKFSDRYVWANSADPDQSDQGLQFATPFACIWPLCLNFRRITAKFLVSEILRTLRYCDFLAVTLYKTDNFHMSLIMRKPAFCIYAKTKTQIRSAPLFSLHGWYNPSTS